MKLLLLQPAAQFAELGVDLDRLRPAARFGTLKPGSAQRRLGDVGAVVNCIDTSVGARRAVEAAARAGVPRVYLFDGIYDVANAYRNPLHRRRGIKQMDPLLYTHVACVDAWSHAAFAALGARTHAWLPARAAPEDGAAPAPGRRAAFLVATARKPAFDAGERGRLERLLRLTVEALDRLGAGYRFRTGDAKLIRALGIPPERNDTDEPFSRCLRRYDALITTPSTVATTAMLAGKPTATLDYRDGPLTQQTGWRLHESADIGASLASMLAPASDRMTFQARQVAHLASRTPVEDFILSAARGSPSEGGNGGRRPSLEYPLRWLYQNWVKPLRRRP